MCHDNIIIHRMLYRDHKPGNSIAYCYCIHMLPYPLITSLHGGIKDENVYSKYYVALQYHYMN